AAGCLRIAVERMASAIKRITIERGVDARTFVLAAFGGAGGQHACQVADALGIGAVLIHPLAGVLSAYGMGLADLRAVRAHAVEAALDAAALDALAATVESLAAAARAELKAQGADAARVQVERTLLLKLAGSDTALPLPWPDRSDAAALAAAFHAAHERHFGFRADDAPIVIESLELEAIASGAAAADDTAALAPDGIVPPPPVA